MKKLAVCLICLGVLSCKKESNVVKSNDVGQLLKKVVLTNDQSAGLSYDIATYEYNSAGMITKEGNKTYVRDDKQRIIQVLEPGTNTNREDIRVHYRSDYPNQINYTICLLKDGDAKDSIVYQHDSNGRVTKKVSYFSYISGDHPLNSYFLSHYDVFTYDDNGNLIQMSFYNVTNDVTVNCGRYVFGGYDEKINPQYANDEIRTMEYFGDAIINASKNNFTSSNSYIKQYEYRADGKPLSCLVRQSNGATFKLSFEYQ